jgi:molybdopterin molybdotransferase
MLTVEQALEQVREASGAPRRRVEEVALADALGRASAEDVAMDHDVPPFRRATMDGFAVHAKDAEPGVVLRVVARVLAGEWPSAPVRDGEAVRVMTGAPVPPGAEAVVPFEWATDEGERVRIERRPSRDANVVERGAHVRSGDTVLRAGTRLDPGALGVLATAGRARVRVAARPRVAILGTGTELVEVGASPEAGQIRNSNGAVLVAQALRAGGRPVDLGIVRDDAATLRAAIRRGLDAEVLLVSGGVSQGDLDLVPGALEAEGVRPRFHRWAVQPGGPLWFGARGDTLVFGLPGNPAASFVGFEVLAVPALRTRLGLPFAPRRTLSALLADAWPGAHPRRRFRPAAMEQDADGRLRARLKPWKGSGDPFGLASAEALAVLPEGGPPAAGATRVDVIPLDGAA